MIVKILLVLFQTVLWHCNHLSQGPNPGDGRECHAIVHAKWSPGFAIIPITPRSRAREVLPALGTVSREKKSRNPNPKWPQIFSRRSRWWEAVLPPCKRKTVLVEKGGVWNIKARHELRVTTDHEIRDTCFTCCHFGFGLYHGTECRGKTYPAITVVVRLYLVPTLGAMAKQKLSKGVPSKQEQSQ